METFISELIDKNPTFLFSKMQKSYRDIEIPDPPVFSDGSIDSLFQMIYYRTHFWDNFDLTDRRFLFMPSYEPKLNNYFKRVLWYQEVDTIIKYMDMMLMKTLPDSLMYRFLIEYLSMEFQDNKMVGHDAIFVHLVKNNQLAGRCTWMDEDLIKRYKMRVEDLEPLLIGTKSVEMVLPDTAQMDHHQLYSSYDMPKKYRVLWFYDHNCHTCKKESLELKAVVDSLDKIGKLNFDVYAVNRTDDIARWKKYIIENGFTWINVGGTKGNVDWTKAYRITSNPQFFIIDQDKKIILNKNISKDMIPKFLEEHERIEAEKARIKNRRQ
jgi:thioredoxin-related protein